MEAGRFQKASTRGAWQATTRDNDRRQHVKKRRTRRADSTRTAGVGRWSMKGSPPVGCEATYGGRMERRWDSAAAGGIARRWNSCIVPCGITIFPPWKGREREMEGEKREIYGTTWDWTIRGTTERGENGLQFPCQMMTVHNPVMRGAHAVDRDGTGRPQRYEIGQAEIGKRRPI